MRIIPFCCGLLIVMSTLDGFAESSLYFGMSHFFCELPGATYTNKTTCDGIVPKNYGRSDQSSAHVINTQWRAKDCFTTLEYKSETGLELGKIFWNSQTQNVGNYWSTARICEREAPST